MASVRVPINGATLRWARLAGHLSEGELGRAANVSVDRVLAFEEESEQPTYPQMRQLAKKLDRPLAFFFTEPPSESDIPVTADFRGGGAEIPGLLARELKRAEAHRRTVLDLDGASPVKPLPAVTRETLSLSTRATREALGIGASDVPTTPLGNATFSYWRGVLEHYGYLVFQTTGIDLGVFRGLSVHHEKLPIIIVNGADSAGGKVFTLFHEVAHLANRTSGLCLLSDDVTDEALCNAFAAEFLMPAVVVSAIPTESDYATAVDIVANHFRVSKLSAAVRLRSLGRITDTDLNSVRAQSDAEWQQNRERLRATPGAPPYSTLRYRDLGPSYVGTVFRAMESDRISILDATYLLDAKVPTIEKMLGEYYRTGGGH